MFMAWVFQQPFHHETRAVVDIARAASRRAVRGVIGFEDPYGRGEQLVERL